MPTYSPTYESSHINPPPNTNPPILTHPILTPTNEPTHLIILFLFIYPPGIRCGTSGRVLGRTGLTGPYKYLTGFF